MDVQGKAKVELTFAIYSGDAVRRETVAQDIVKVGKDPRSHLRVDDELASRMHAVIEVASASDMTLIDLGNEPGTLVNGQRINKCKLHVGDEVQIGNTRVVLEQAGMMGAAVPVAPATEMGLGGPTPGNPFAVPAQAANPFAGANPFAPAAAGNPFGANPFAAAPPTPPSSPFSSPTAAAAVAVTPTGLESLDGHGAVYSMVKSGPDVMVDEVEVPHLSAVEVIVMWDANILNVSHLTPVRSYYVGEEAGVDYFLASESLGTTRAPVVVGRGNGASLVILPRARGLVDIPGQGKVSLEELVRSGRARPSSELSGAHEFDLPPGAKARVEVVGPQGTPTGVAFQVSAVNAGKPVPVGLLATLEFAIFAFIGASFILHMGLIALFAFFMPSGNWNDGEEIDRDQMLMMQKLLSAAAEREQEQRETEQVAENTSDNKEGGTGTRAKGEEGSMGNPNTKDTNKRYAVQKKDDSDQHLARQAAMQEAAQFGMIGLIAAMGGGDPNAPTAPWGREDSNGADDRSARGNMFGDSIGDAFGAGGLGLSGVGEGGGGRGEGVGLGNFGGLGHGAGTGSGQGIGSGRGRLQGGHAVRSPKMREGAASVNGRLPPEVIQRIVRQNFGRFRLCYESGLKNNPELRGRVAVRFVIDRTGAVSMTSDGGSDIADQGVVQCVVRGFGNLSFPQPEGGIVTVVYPLSFTPD